VLQQISPASSSTSSDNSRLVSLLLDAASGTVLASHMQPAARFAQVAVAAEHWHAYVFFNLRLNRYEASVSELYFGNETSAAAKPLVYSQTYVVPAGNFGALSSAAAVSQSLHGVTPRVIVAATDAGQVLQLDRRLLDARRRTVDQVCPPPVEGLTVTLPQLSQSELADGAVPYHPLVQPSVLSHSRQVSGIREVVCAPTERESTVQVLPRHPPSSHLRCRRLHLAPTCSTRMSLPVAHLICCKMISRERR
jgi:hypothetical protein